MRKVIFIVGALAIVGLVLMALTRRPAGPPGTLRPERPMTLAELFRQHGVPMDSQGGGFAVVSGYPATPLERFLTAQANVDMDGVDWIVVDPSAFAMMPDYLVTPHECVFHVTGMTHTPAPSALEVTFDTKLHYYSSLARAVEECAHWFKDSRPHEPFRLMSCHRWWSDNSNGGIIARLEVDDAQRWVDVEVAAQSASSRWQKPTKVDDEWTFQERGGGIMLIIQKVSPKAVLWKLRDPTD